MNNNKQSKKNHEEIKHIFTGLNREFLKSGFSTKELYNACLPKERSNYANSGLFIAFLGLAFLVISTYQYEAFSTAINYFLGVRCIVPNNYFVWEATRPVSDCNFCINITNPIVLQNVTRKEFAPYAYTSKPVVIKKAFLHWAAMKHFDFNFFKELYSSIEDSYRSVDEECQFLHFKSNFISIRDVFEMTEARINNEPGEKSWYVGWGNCHPQILAEMRRYYPKPHFLPESCEIPSKEYVFMGYDDGATMHLDFINRLMWQAQLKGSKTWHLIPPPECEDVCSQFSFLVEPGDAILVDTRVWYHGTTITPGEFSLSVQSEYG
ncbi:hypothetical protein Zmor_007326 [Zophobas morio]|uniref:Cupin-like domain-containing protein n=1 Tax=Zophobas morio TaxID=2755281 RepID=A0AA38ITQ7_9CUCU|nr:hypothetical protein Zmor_007326 [Zophobas morio]